MLRIGEFARIGGVSMKTLRHYDRLGLLKPAHIDPTNDYRHYEVGQLGDLMRILALKDCGFALEEIGDLLHDHDTAAIIALLQDRVAAQQAVVATEQDRLARLVGRLRQLSDAATDPAYDVALKRTEALTLVGLRRWIAGQAQIEALAIAVGARLAACGVVAAGPMVHLYHAIEADGERMDVFVGAPVMAVPAAVGDLLAVRLGADEEVACVLFRGDYAAIRNAYIALGAWLDGSGYRRSGPAREIYHRSPAHTPDPTAYVTEIQFPIQRSPYKEDA